MTTQYEFDLQDMPDYFQEIFEEILQNKTSEFNGDSVTPETLVQIYKESLIELAQQQLGNIKGVISNQNISIVKPVTDPLTQERIQQWFDDHIKSRKQEILNTIIPLFGSYFIDHSRIIVNFADDYAIVEEKVADIYSTAVGLCLGEYTTFLQRQIEDDSKHLVELSRLIHQTPQADLPKCVADYCGKNGKNLIDKYSTIIFHMHLYGFNPEKFVKTMEHFGMNLSKPFSDLMLMYFRLSLPNDRSLKAKLDGIREHIKLWEMKMEEIRNQENTIRETSQRAVKNRYLSHLNRE